MIHCVYKVLFVADFPPPEGGVTVLVKLLADTLSKDKNIVVTRLDTMLPGSRTGRSNSAFEFLYTFILYLFKLLLEIPWHDVVTVHLPSNKLGLYALPALIFSKIFRKRLILRKFGGTDFYTYNWLIRTITDFAIRHSYKYLCETKELVTIAKKHGISNVEWFPNHRKMPTNAVTRKQKNNYKIVFLGLVTVEKGVLDAIRAVSHLTNCTLDVYGPLKGDISANQITSVSNCFYRGAIDSNKVPEMLSEYDILMLPSYREGYPGVILEAFGAGLPIVATTLPSLQELIPLSAGLLVSPGDIEAIRSAIMSVIDNINNMSSSSLREANKYSLAYWTDRFILICK